MTRTSRSRFVFSILGITALMAVATAPVSQATLPGVNGRIVFDHGGKIYTVNPDGSGLLRVTAGPTDTTPEWSPDGHSIAFSRARDPNSSLGRTIWIANADGTQQRRLTPQDPKSGSFFPRFTPNGQSIVYQNCLGFDCDGGIFAIHTDGTQLRHITPNSGDSYNWAEPSPDGRSIAFMRWHVGGAMMRIYVIRSDGTHQRAVTPIALEAWAPDWAPNGQTILFTSNNYGNRPNGALYSIRPDGGALRRLNQPRFPYSNFDASYAPDGTAIVFASNRRYPALNHADLFIMRADGTGAHRIALPFNDAGDARWGPTPAP